MIKADKSLSKHRFSIGFNEPPEAYIVDMEYHFCGPVTQNMLQKAHGFRENLGSDLKELPGRDYMNAYMEYVIQMKKKADYKEHIAFLEQNALPLLKEKGIHVKFFPKD